MADEVTRLAYDEARAALREQDATLGTVRNRATGLLAAAAVGTSFSATAGLLNVDPKRGQVFPAWAAWALLVAVVLVAASVMIVLWPTPHWQYGPSPSKLLSFTGTDINKVLEGAAKAMVTASEINDRTVRHRVSAYQAAVLLLMVEIVLLIVALLINRW